jgi:hypothetical protein
VLRKGSRWGWYEGRLGEGRGRDGDDDGEGVVGEEEGLRYREELRRALFPPSLVDRGTKRLSAVCALAA